MIFIGGITLMVFAAATRVVLTEAEGEARLPFLNAMDLLLVGATVLRVTGDFNLGSRGTLLNLAAYLWLIAAAVWCWRVLPRMRAT